ncbi:MAG: SDR family oxidoreductase [Chromatiales bacterium]|nr:SDR family oxidoreductase [Chromatiales bacterium]
MILVTGATGKTGAAAANALLAKGAKVRALVRNEEKAAGLKQAGAELVVGDVNDAAVLAQALEGCEKALLTLPNSQQQLDQEKRFTDAAVKAGLRHLVKLSSMEARPDAKAPIPALHWQSEEYIRKSGLGWTMIKPNFFMQNLLGSAGTIKEQGKFFLPLGDGKTAMIDTRDIGDVVAAVLTGDGHIGQSYEVTGPELLTFHDAADRISKAIGRKVEYVNVPMDSYRQTLARFLTNEWHLNAVIELFGEIASGADLAHTTDTVKKLLGREPKSLEAFIREHKALFGA